MERSPVRDFMVGVFVLGGLGALAWLSIDIGGFKWHGREGMKLYAKFTETGGLTERAPVVIAGVQVGEVKKITLTEDNSGFRALVEMDVQKNLHLTTDTFASIYTAGMLGDKYISLKTGADDTYLKSGDEITMVENSIVLEQILKAVMYGLTKSDSGKESSAGGTEPATQPAKDVLQDTFKDVLKKKSAAEPATAPK